MDAEHTVGFGIGDDLYKAVCVAVGLGAAVGHHREFADLDLALCLCLFLGQADAGDFRIGVDDAGNDVMVHNAGKARDEFGGGNALVFRLVREHRAGDDVANGVDAGDAGLEIMADFDLATSVDSQARLVEGEAFGIGLAANGDEDAIGLNAFRRATCGRFDGQCCGTALDGGAGDLGAGADIKALLLEDFGGFLADFAIHAGQDLVEILNHGDLCAEAKPHAAKLKPDHAAADDDEMLGHLGQGERTGGIDDDLLIDGDAR